MCVYACVWIIVRINKDMHADTYSKIERSPPVLRLTTRSIRRYLERKLPIIYYVSNTSERCGNAFSQIISTSVQINAYLCIVETSRLRIKYAPCSFAIQRTPLHCYKKIIRMLKLSELVWRLRTVAVKKRARNYPFKSCLVSRARLANKYFIRWLRIQEWRRKNNNEIFKKMKSLIINVHLFITAQPTTIKKKKQFFLVLFSRAIKVLLLV